MIAFPARRTPHATAHAPAHPTRDPAGVALVLAGHGSSDDPRWAAPVHRHAAAIAARGTFAEVRCVFWQQEPRFDEVCRLTSAPEIVVVPLMTADGYYARIVLPREVELGRTADDVRAVRYGPPIGALDRIADVVIAAARDAARDAGADLRASRILLVGHGTERMPRASAESTRRCARAIASRGVCAGVRAAFLSQSPRVRPESLDGPGLEPVVVVPFLVANGAHATVDVPAALGLAPGASAGVIEHRLIVVAGAVGERPEVADLILESALEAGAAEGRGAARPIEMGDRS